MTDNDNSNSDDDFDTAAFVQRMFDEIPGARQLVDESKKPEPDPIEMGVTKAEAEAPLDTTGPLPRTVSTLKYIPQERRQQYKRTMSGEFTLAWLTSDDEASIQANNYGADGKGLLPVYAPGDSPTKQAERGKANEAMVAKIIAEANARDAAEAERKRKAAHEAAIARVNKRFGMR